MATRIPLDPTGGEGGNDSGETLRPLDCAIAVVSPEPFVAAVAAERDLNVSARLSREVVGREGGRVREWSAEGGGEPGQVFGGVGFNAKLMVIGAQVSGYLGGIPALVVARVVEADAERLDRAVLARAGGDDAGIHAAGEKDPEGDVGDELPVD